MPLSFPARAAPYTPYFNRWNEDAYLRGAPFAERPFDLATSSTSGAVVLVVGDLFVGARRREAVEFGWNGETVMIDGPADVLFQHPAGTAAWPAYHQALGLPEAAPPAAGRRPEYCTWVEQKWTAAMGGRAPQEVLTADFVRRYLEAVAHSSWPAGRFTIDEGWCTRHGSGGFGDWQPRHGIDLAALADEIRGAGHVPGLWLAPQLISDSSDLARNRPDLIGPPWEMAAESNWAGFRFLRPGDAAREFLRSLFRRVYDWGFRKLKLDLCYGPKALMIELHAAFAEAARGLPGEVELEGHVPDPFAAAHVQSVRLNDCLIAERFPQWRRVAEAHFRVCRESAPRHVLNLDHLGGNDCAVTVEQWCEHADLMRGWLPFGYPVISLLPAHVGDRAVEATQDLLQQANHPVA